MPISIKEIVKNWEMLSTGTEYFEQEIFTKFEDAFICAYGGSSIGIKIIHHSRSFVECAEFSTLPCIKVADPYCELADLRLLAYSLKEKKTARLLFLQFKKASKNGRGHFAEIGEKQMLLFSKFPEVSFHGTGSIPKEVLKDPIHKKSQSGAMFAMIEYDQDERKNELRFMNHTKLDPDKPKYKLSDEGKHYYVNEIETKYNPDPKIVPNPDFAFCDYVPSFKDFVDNVKDLKVGREIEIADILHHISKEELPDDLKKYYEENINNPNENDSGNVEENESNMLVNLVDTIAINVDELVD